MKFTIICVFLLFIVIGICKNKHKNYAKQAGVSLMLLGTLNALALHNNNYYSGGDSVQYLDVFFINPERVELYGNLSIGVALIGLIIYLFSEIKR
ncbi:hypothetical protein [Bacillus timonensis]|uniref:hypothetical protein n=1 Tax=Bacillus timonensis TaxID=1033734 RepID=UPI000289A732|nr:hypothetical protein [Bacillus timonensis]